MVSEKPIVERLQVKNGRTLAAIDAPAAVDKLIGGKSLRAQPAVAEVIILFVENLAKFEALLPKLLSTSRTDSIIWVAYPKLSSPLADDLSRDVINKLAPKFKTDTVSQIAINDDWSALRLKRI